MTPRTFRGSFLPWLIAVLLVVALLVFAVAKAQAQDVTCPPGQPISGNAALLCWTNATVDVDDQPLPPSGPGSLKQTRVQRVNVAVAATCTWGTTAAPENFDVTPDVTMMFFENLAQGKWCFRLRHVNNEDVVSDWTAAVSKVVVKPIGKSKQPTVTIY
jgi:hypothetical protein